VESLHLNEVMTFHLFPYGILLRQACFRTPALRL
jgi:hypothetical protein